MRLKRLGLLILCIFVCMGVVEATLRLFQYPYMGCTDIDVVSEYQLGQYDSVLGWSYMRPHTTTLWDTKTYTFNADGYRAQTISDTIAYQSQIYLSSAIHFYLDTD